MNRVAVLTCLLGVGAVGISAPYISHSWANARNEFSSANLVALRSQGPAGLRKFMEAHAAEIQQLRANPATKDQKLVQVKLALDSIGGAHDNWAAGLYWHTDLEAAKAQAKREGKPILSLRMLGDLREEYSCANSRFFRGALYPNSEINALLRDKYVLHWSSERPVPVVTIDFGDGRKMKRTLTGNSAHYLLDAEERPLDVLPGLYTPKAFAGWLEDGTTLHGQVTGKANKERQETLETWHRTKLEKIWTDYAAANDMLQRRVNNSKVAPPAGTVLPTWVEVQVKNSLHSNPLNRERPADNPYNVSIPAETAGRFAATKMRVEQPILDATRLFGPPASAPSGNPFTISRRGDEYGNYSRTFLAGATLDASSRAVIESQLPNLNAAPVREVAANAGDKPPVISQFENSMAVDTARNEMQMHIPIHAAFVRGEQGTFQELNTRIYNSLFLTPASDPWLGLELPDTYTGLTNGGIVPPSDVSNSPVRQVRLKTAKG